MYGLPRGLDVADERIRHAAVGAHQNLLLQRVFTPDRNFEHVLGTDPIGG